jgi:dolichyl-phosphate-mannose-protein mannosyltransferase
LMYYFMFRYYEMSFYKEKLGKTLTMLFLCGLMFGLGSACKWIGLYAGAGLAILFFITLWRRWREYRYAQDNIADAEGENKAVFEHAIRVYTKYTWITLGCAVAFFLIIPALIYYASYFPYMLVKDHPYNFQGILDLQKYMYNYHSTLTERHPYEAAWYMWLVDARPIWFYYQADTGIAGAISSISSFGNPAVWWSGLFAAIFCIFSVFRRKGEEKRFLIFLLFGLASQFIPWLFITRATFIYHYFASIPFIILLTVYCVRRIERRFPKVQWLTYAFMAVVIVLFALFYPIISGVPAQKTYFSDVLRWFQSWVFYL